jgi:hypothetical protein
VKDKLNQHGDLHITARDENNDVAKIRISIIEPSFNKIPLTSVYFVLGNTDVDGDTIEGFSPDIKRHPEKLSEFTALDFSNQTDTHIKYISGNCRFDSDILNQ